MSIVLVQKPKWQSKMTTTLRIDDELKRDCDSGLKEIGLSFSNAVTPFLRQVVRTGTHADLFGK